MNIITHTFVGLKCLTETKIQILCDHVDHTRFHIVEMGRQMVQLLSAHIVGPTLFVNLTPALYCIQESLIYYLVFVIFSDTPPLLNALPSNPKNFINAPRVYSKHYGIYRSLAINLGESSLPSLIFFGIIGERVKLRKMLFWGFQGQKWFMLYMLYVKYMFSH